MKNSLLRRSNGRIQDGKIGTMGNPKGRKPQGFGDLVVGVNGVNAEYTEGDKVTNGSEFERPIERLEELIQANKGDPSLKNFHLIEIIGHVEVLQLAYELIKSKTGNMTPGTTQETLDGIDQGWFTKTSEKLLNGTFSFRPSRRVQIPKPGKTETRPLGVVSPRDKIVQKSALLVLEAIYEPQFLETSHGFRPGKGNHTCLKYLRFQLQGKIWVLEADLRKCFDSIDHEVLMHCLEKRIGCEATLKLIRQALTAGYIEPKISEQIQTGTKGTPQGSILSPILSNIVLHELDSFMENLKNTFSKGKSRRTNPQFYKVWREFKNATSSDQKRKIRHEKLWKIHSKDPKDPNFRRLVYARYADDFLVGITGSHGEAKAIKSQISDFLSKQLKLELNDEKSVITHFSKGPKKVHFLGADIFHHSPKQKHISRVKHADGNITKSRVTLPVRLEAPMAKLIQKALQNGFYRNDGGKIRPTGRTNLINLDHADIITYYNQVIRGIMNYYSFADNRASLGSLIHGLKHSCALTLALKYKVGERAKVFKKFGSLLQCKETGRKLELPQRFERTNFFQVNVADPNIALSRSWSNKLTKSNIGKGCLICNKKAEMHHVKTIQDLKSKMAAKSGKIDFWTFQMRAINRKQIPLCRDHHLRMHHNKLDEDEIFTLTRGIQQFLKKKKDSILEEHKTPN